MTAPIRTVVDVAAGVSERLLEEITDDAVIRGLAPLPSLTRRFGELRGSGRAGSSRLERALASWGDRMPQEVAEKRLDRRLRAWLTVAPVLQHEVRSEGGLVGFVDAAFPDRKVGYELNSFR